jgi:hypothetical protein
MTKLNIWIGRALWFGRSDLICKVRFGALLDLLIFTLADFFGVPYLVRHTVVPDMAIRLKRRVQVGKVGFNPFSLRLKSDNLRVGGLSGSQPFLQIRKLHCLG